MARNAATEVAPRLTRSLADCPPERWDPELLMDVARALRRAGLTAESRTLRVMTCPWESPFHPSPRGGPTGVRPRFGFRPNNPQLDAGIRIDPPPSVACAAGTMPAATAAAAPPLDPPAEWSRFHGLRVGPNSSGSVDALSPISGVLVLPKTTSPARS